MKKIILIILIGLIVTISFFINLRKDEGEKQQLVFASHGKVLSSDTLDFDYYINQVSFSSIYGRLVSSDKAGIISSELAESWSNFNNFKVWHFKLKKNLKYSNGDQILSKDILLNFKRLLFLAQKSNSKSGVLEFISNCNLKDSLNKNCEGLKLNGDVLEITFSKPMNNLLNLISFGLYGLAHPSLYDHYTGNWIDKKKSISSSNYEVEKWSDSDFIIKLRNDSNLFGKVGSINRIKIINLADIKEKKDLDDVDLIFADRKSLLVDERFQFVGSSLNLKIGYLKVHSWQKKKSELSRIEVRKWLRSKFYSSLENNGIVITKSFMPTSLTGVVDIKSSYLSDKPKIRTFTLVVPDLKISGKLKEFTNKKSIAEIFKDAYASLKDEKVDLNYLNSSGDYDVEILGTGIEANDYMDTLRFMFLSTEGIKLPDSNGKILNELKKERPDVNLINKEIWDQALIWPIRHYSSGYWYKNSSKINLRMINIDSPSIDFQFVKWD